MKEEMETRVGRRRERREGGTNGLRITFNLFKLPFKALSFSIVRRKAANSCPEDEQTQKIREEKKKKTPHL